jgi:curli biogenesis system outer membrane secretion channel CsgG
MLRTELVRTGTFNVVEKQSMDRILAEQTFQQTGCTSDECAVRLGRLLNVRYIVMGSFGKFIGRYMLNVRVVSVETGKIIFADSTKGQSVEDVERGVRILVQRIKEKIQP